MANSVLITPGSGETIAAEEILGAKWQRISGIGFRGDSTKLAFNVTATSAQGVAVNAARAGLFLQNLSGENVFGAFNATPVATAGAEDASFCIPAWGTWTMDRPIDTRLINFVRLAVGTSHVIGMEWTIT